MEQIVYTARDMKRQRTDQQHATLDTHISSQEDEKNPRKVELKHVCEGTKL